MMKFASLKYDFSENLGDDIQSLATEQFFPRIDKKLNRDSLGCVSQGEKYLVIMNGWFSHFPAKCFPPSDSIMPVFIGFHLTDWNDTAEYFLSPKGIEYFKRNEPIGCRDKRTMERLTAKGIKAFYSKCLTLTFPKREAEPKEGKVILVDASHIPIPEFLHKQAITVSHWTPDIYGHELKTAMAKKLLAIYRNEASLVITTKLHCALPCIAMGVPVLFFGRSKDYRISILKDLNININRLPCQWIGFLYKALRNRFWGKIFRKIAVKLLYGNVDWNPQSVCIEKEKNELKKITEELVKIKIIEAEMKKSQQGI